MHFICIYHIPLGLNLKNIFRFFTAKLLLKKHTYVFKTFYFWPYLGQFLSDLENL